MLLTFLRHAHEADTLEEVFMADLRARVPNFDKYQRKMRTLAENGDRRYAAAVEAFELLGDARDLWENIDLIQGPDDVFSHTLACMGRAATRNRQQPQAARACHGGRADRRGPCRRKAAGRSTIRPRRRGEASATDASRRSAHLEDRSTTKMGASQIAERSAFRKPRFFAYKH